jgi:alpha-1,6-mannosyltransferase
MKRPDSTLVGRLADARGNRVVFLSHCLLDENVRYLGGAFHSGAAPETLAVIRSGVGICQMPCPEMRAWGGVQKQRMLLAYGLRDTKLYALRRPLFGLFIAATRLSYWRLARSVADEIEQYRDAGVTVLGVVGIGASPSCGVTTTLDLARSFETVAGCPLAAIDCTLVNQHAVADCRVGGAGLFVRALRRQLSKRGIDVRFLEHDLIAEMHGVEQRLDLGDASGARLGAPAVGSSRRSRPVVVDVAMFHGPRSGGIRTYLNEKARVATTSGLFEHDVIVPGRRELHEGGRHEVRSLRMMASNGYRIPLGVGALKDTLRRLQPDFVLLHDPFWGPHGVTELAHELGAKVIAVHHATPALGAAAIPGPNRLYEPVLRRVYRHVDKSVDAVLSVVDPLRDTGREATIPLRFGLDAAFRPEQTARGEHLLYVGRLSLEKRIEDLFAAAAALDPPRSVLVVGDGPARHGLMTLAEHRELGSSVSFRPFVDDRAELARLYREAACVVDPGPHETFGLVVFEAAASGARVVASDSTPAATAASGLIETFAGGDVDDLRRAINRALARTDDLERAGELAERSTWERVFATELEALERLRDRTAGPSDRIGRANRGGSSSAGASSVATY